MYALTSRLRIIASCGKESLCAFDGGDEVRGGEMHTAYFVFAQ